MEKGGGGRKGRKEGREKAVTEDEVCSGGVSIKEGGNNRVGDTQKKKKKSD